MRMRHRIWIVAVLAAAACDAGPYEPDGPFLGLQAELYLTAALDIMENNSIRKYEIEWPAFREIALDSAYQAAAIDPVDTYPMIVDALERIGDQHSFFRPAPGTVAAVGPAPVGGSARAAPATVAPSTDLVAPGVGYIDVPEFNGGGAEADSLASTYHRLIEAVDTLGPTCRWVVDLRGNLGGNMWPMIAGVGPVLGEGVVGFFLDPDSVVLPWTYSAGSAEVDGVSLALVPEPYELVWPFPYVAVLTDSLTASSGEAVAVAFRGRPETRSFGGSTWGVSTANSAFPMPDGAVIFLTVSTMVDRLGTVYGGELVPDEPVEGGEKTGDPATDAVLAAAVAWLEAQSCG